MTQSAEDSHARTSASPEVDLDLTVPEVDYGANISGSFARYDRASHSLRTPQLCLDGDFQEFSATLPRIGYHAEWEIIRARSIGAQHLRERVWIVAYADSERKLQFRGSEQDERGWVGSCPEKSSLADTPSSRLQGRSDARANGDHASYLPTRAGLAELAEKFDLSYWRYPPLVGGRLHGISSRLDRIGALGNAVLPQIPEAIGRQIMKAINRVSRTAPFPS